MNTTPSSATRALVLGGGGALGNAWLIGVIAGLSDAGLDVADADLIIGTSAGSTAAAQITGADPAQLFAATLSPVPGARRGGTTGPVANHLDRLNEIISVAHDPADLRLRLGAAALAQDDSDGSKQRRWRATVTARLPQNAWPRQRLLVTAIDAHSGEPVEFDRDSGVELVDAVAASTSNGIGAPAYRIGERAYLDGGYRRSSENADLAMGCGRVLVLSPLGGRTLLPLEWGMQLATQVEELEAGGSRVETVLPDQDALDAFGGNMMNLSARPAAARAGHAQGRVNAGRLAEFWR